MLLRGVSMEEALETLVAQTQLDLVVSSELIKDKQVFCSKKDAQPEALLQCILRDSGLDYIRSSSGTYILIEAIQQAPLFGDLAGSITDLETGMPLPYANVLLADGSSGTTTNQDGFFSFKSLISGLQRVVVTYVGYETTMDSIWVQPGAKSRINIELQSSALSVGPIVIDGLEQRIPSQDLGNPTLDGNSMVGMSAHGTPDVMRGASKLAGVSILQPLAGVQIQGGISNEHVTLLDGAPVRDPVALGRYLGAFSPLAIKRMTVHKAGYGARYGSHLTGFVAIDQDLHPTDRYSATFMLDPVSANGQVKGRFNLNEAREGLFMVAARTSNWNLYQDRGIQALLENWSGIDPFLTSLWTGESVAPTTLTTHTQTPLIAFSDLHFASRIKLSPYQNLHASLYRASNRIASDLVVTNDLLQVGNDLFVITSDRYSWLNWAGQLKHSWLLGNQSALSTQIKGSWHDSRYSYRASNDFIEDQPSTQLVDLKALDLKSTLADALSSSERNFIRELTVSSTLSHSFSPFHHTDVGVEFTHVDTEFDFRNAFVAPLVHHISTTNLAAFVHNQIALNAYATVEPGVRLTYLPIHKKAYLEPRLALRLDAVSPLLGNYAIRLAGGMYRQYVNQYDLTSFGTTSAAPSILFWLPLDASQSPPLASHLAVEMLITPGVKWTISAESFIKWQEVLTVDYAGLQELEGSELSRPQDQFIKRADGRSYGASLHAARSGNWLTLKAGYDYILSEQQFPNRFNDERIAVPWNTPHQVRLDASAQLSPSFSLEANWVNQWGKKWALRRAYYDFLAFRPLPLSLTPFDLTSPLNDETPRYQRLDLGATVQISSNAVRSSIQFFVLNVLDKENVFDQLLQPASPAALTSPRSLPGRQFTLSFRVDY